MFSVQNNITIEQTPTADYPSRRATIYIDFLTAYEYSSSWAEQASKGSITIPKNLYYRSYALNPLTGTLINIGGFGSTPFIMRGDKVTLKAGYVGYNLDTIAEGWVSKVHSSIPMQFDIEDNMFILKQTVLKPKTFSKTDSLEDVLKYITDSVTDKKLTYLANSVTTFGEFKVNDETAASLLDRLNKTFGFNSYFRGNELRSGINIYVEQDINYETFIMNGAKANVVESNLEYFRKDDIPLSAKVYSVNTAETGETTKDGKAKTKKERLTILCSYFKGQQKVTVIGKDGYVPENQEGERRTFFFPNITSTDKLAELGFAQLKNYYYDGFKGSFTTFGYPFVKHGDEVILKNPKLPEQDGKYKVKRVNYTGGTDGLRQDIEIDFRIP